MPDHDDDQRLRRDVIWNVVPVVLLGAVGVGVNFLIGAWWGEAALGVFMQVSTAFMVVSVLGAGGLQYSALRAVAAAGDDPAKIAAVVVGVLVPALVFGACATAAFVALAPALGDLFDSDAVATGMLWAAPGLFSFAINKVLFGVVNGLRRMRAFAVYTSLRYAFIAIAVVIAYALDVGAAKLSVIWSFVETAVMLLLIGDVVASVQLRRCSGWSRWVVAHVSFGVRGVAATLGFELNNKLGIWMLGIVMSDARVGIFSMAAALAEGVLMLAVVVQNNLNPMIARALAAGDAEQVRALLTRVRRWFVPGLAGTCVISALCYPFIVPFVIGNPAFGQGAASYAILVAGIALSSPWLPFNQVMLMASRPGWHTVFVLLTIGSNFVGNVLLIPHLGMEGSATATAVTLVLSMILLVRIARTRAGVHL